MEIKQKQTLYIPQGLKIRVEIFDGYGKEELFKTVIITLISGLVDVLLFLVFRNVVVSIVFMLVMVSGSVMMLTKDKSNISVIDQVRFMVKFARSQKIYKYKYLEEWK